MKFLANYIADEPIEIDDDSKLDLVEDLQTVRSPHTISDEESYHAQLDVEAPSALSDGPPYEPCNSPGTTGDSSSLCLDKGVRSASPCQIS